MAGIGNYKLNDDYRSIPCPPEDIVLLEDICDPLEIVQNIKRSLQQPNGDLKHPDDIGLDDSGRNLQQSKCDSAGRDINECDNNGTGCDLRDIERTGRDLQQNDNIDGHDVHRNDGNDTGGDFLNFRNKDNDLKTVDSDAMGAADKIPIQNNNLTVTADKQSEEQHVSVKKSVSKSTC